MEKFKAYILREKEDELVYGIEEISKEFLSEGTTLIKSVYSSLNYKDMLAFKKNGGVIRKYPMIPGIDLAGIVVSDTSGNYQTGDEVIVTGCDMGVTTTGALSEYVSVKSEWIVPLPKGLTLKEAMIYGTAGYTAAQAILALVEHGMSADNQPRLLVTGASGGVGSVAIAILNKMGFDNITALIRKDNQEEIVRKLGSHHVIRPEELGVVKPLASAKWDFVIDNVGGAVAATALTQISEFGSMSMCGNAAGFRFETSLLPIILRGVNILGINSIYGDYQLRMKLWDLLANEWNVIDKLHFNEYSFDDVEKPLSQLREGKHLGRSIIHLNS